MKDVLAAWVGTVMLTVTVLTATAQTTKPQDDWSGLGKSLAPTDVKGSPTGDANESQVAEGSAEELGARPSPFDKPFEVKFKPYFWIPSYKGSTTIAGNKLGIDADFTDMLHLLDEIECIVPINLEARWKNWGVIIDLLYLKLEDKNTIGPITSKVRLEQEILELAEFYRLGTWPLGKKLGWLSLDVLGGARYNRIQGDVGLFGRRRTLAVSGTQEWWDPFVGPRVTWRPCEKLCVFARGDVGGFGLEDSSDCTWQIVTGAHYDFTRYISVEAGYRLLDTDYQTGSGKRQFGWDVQMGGPYLALVMRF